MASSCGRQWGENTPGNTTHISTSTSNQGSGGYEPASQPPHFPADDESQSKPLEQTTNTNGKRPRAESSRVIMSYPRKRAVAACQLCRARKRKCNNARPKCKFCEDAGVDCNYGDPGDHSSFDPASLVMIEKLNQIIERLNTHHDPIRDATDSSVGHQLSAPVVGESPGSQNSSLQKAQVENVENSLDIPSSRTTSDKILLWPIFEGRYPPEYLVDTLFEAEPEYWDHGTEIGVHDSSQSLVEPSKYREDKVDELVESFIAYVHTKNPILDVKTLRGYATRVVEDGPSWDGGSCLVFLACALGALGGPFEPNIGGNPTGVEPSISSKARSERDLQTAESNYALAARRIGLLKNSLVRSQCYFWSGVYLMYTLRPLEAWEKFFHASATYNIYLKSRLKKDNGEKRYTSSTRLLEQRLYWSCFKSECEIRVELNLPESSISSIGYPDMFPSPPNDVVYQATDLLPSPGSSETAMPSVAEQSGRHPREERTSGDRQTISWYYYLSEIALRRISNNVLNAFYRDDRYPGAGITIHQMIMTATNFLDQMSQWFEGLPSAIKYNQEDWSDSPQDELAEFTRGRSLEIYTWLFRPFLYYTIHHPADDPHRASIQQFVDGALKMALATMSAGGRHFHRHHGMWFQLRSSIASALSIIAAHKCGHVILPSGWRGAVRYQISILEYWGEESSDIAKARDVLSALMIECEAG